MLGIISSSKEITNALKKIQKDEPPGEDGATIEMVKEGRCNIINCIGKLLNKFLEEVRFPEEWESANVNIFLKKGDKANLNNYSPISLLSQLYKKQLTLT